MCWGRNLEETRKKQKRRGRNVEETKKKQKKRRTMTCNYDIGNRFGDHESQEGVCKLKSKINQ